MLVNPKRGLAHKKTSFDFHQGSFFVVLYFWHVAWRRTIKEDLRFSVLIRELAENPMKADVINALSGWSVLAVPGVNALKKLKASLETLKSKGLKRVQTAFDMDMLTNPNVKNGFEELLALLDEMDFTFGTYLWDPRYKGLDDYLWEGKLKKVRAEGGLVE